MLIFGRLNGNSDITIQNVFQLSQLWEKTHYRLKDSHYVYTTMWEHSSLLMPKQRATVTWSSLLICLKGIKYLVLELFFCILIKSLTSVWYKSVLIISVKVEVFSDEEEYIYTLWSAISPTSYKLELIFKLL
jgi:hypothetical protein